MKKQFIVAAALSMLSLSAAAEGFYALGDVGQGKVSADFDNNFTYSKTETSYSLGVGYDFNQTFGAELGYRNFGTSERRDSFMGTDYKYETESSAFTLSGIAKLPVSDKVNVYGRLGVGKIVMDDTVNWSADGDTGHDSSSDSTYRVFGGIGASYAINEQISLRAEYSQFARWDDFSLSSLTLGATYHF